MADENPSIMNHVSIVVSDYQKSLAFYDAVLGVLGGRRVMDFPDGVSYGKAFPEFWVQPKPYDGGEGSTGRGIHFAFSANSRAQVEDFYKTAIANGASDDGPPGPRPEYGQPYFGCFVRDPDGHKIEATFWDESIA